LREVCTVVALPRRQLLAHQKVNLAPGSKTVVTVSISLPTIAGSERQDFPGILQMWAGHAGGNHAPHVGAPGQGTAFVYVNLTLVL